MFDDFESNITFEIPKNNINYEKLTMANNYTFLLTSLDEIRLRDSHEKLSRHILNANGDEHNRFIGDIWIGCILIFLIVLSIFCASSYYLYYKFRQWKNNYINRRLSTESYQTESSNIDIESLPNYTLVSGLPSYDDAIEQLKNYRDYYSNKMTLPTLFHQENECKHCGEYFTTTTSTIIHPSLTQFNEPNYRVIDINNKNHNIDNRIATTTTAVAVASSSSGNIPSYDDAVSNLLSTNKLYTQQHDINKEYNSVPSYEEATSLIKATTTVTANQQNVLNNEIDNKIENSNT